MIRMTINNNDNHDMTVITMITVITIMTIAGAPLVMRNGLACDRMMNQVVQVIHK